MTTIPLTAKETAVMTAIGQNKLPGFTEGITSGSGTWHKELCRELTDEGLAVSSTPRGAATVIRSLNDKGLLYTHDSGQGDWTVLTEAGAELANLLTKPVEEQTETHQMAIVEASTRTCKCGCGELVGKKSFYRPGHDARHVSNLVRMWRAGEIVGKDAIAHLAHSDKLIAKFNQQVANSPQKDK